MRGRLISPQLDIGARLLIEGTRAILTSVVEVVGRPDKSAVFSYCSQAWTGEIG